MEKNQIKLNFHTKLKHRWDSLIKTSSSHLHFIYTLPEENIFDLVGPKITIVCQIHRNDSRVFSVKHFANDNVVFQATSFVVVVAQLNSPASTVAMARRLYTMKHRITSRVAFSFSGASSKNKPLDSLEGRTKLIQFHLNSSSYAANSLCFISNATVRLISCRLLPIIKLPSISIRVMRALWQH